VLRNLTTKEYIRSRLRGGGGYLVLFSDDGVPHSVFLFHYLMYVRTKLHGTVHVIGFLSEK
jgi:hypothetical protein